MDTMIGADKLTDTLTAGLGSQPMMASLKEQDRLEEKKKHRQIYMRSECFGLAQRRRQR
jgi:hypothetical protein